jgi:DNA-binding NarL/FixJ family response regulator
MTQQTTASTISVLLADDHAIFADALKARLSREPDFHPVSLAYSAEQLRTNVICNHPSVVVLDIAVGGESGVALAGRIREISPQTRVVMLSAVQPVTATVAAVRCGVRAWLSKTVGADDLVRAIRGVAQGEAWFAPDVLGQVLTALMHRAPEAPGALTALTPREAEVLQCLVNGMTRQQIALRLHLTSNTVRTHIQNLLGKSGAHTTLELTALALRHGFRSTDS